MRPRAATTFVFMTSGIKRQKLAWYNITHTLIIGWYRSKNGPVIFRNLKKILLHNVWNIFEQDWTFFHAQMKWLFSNQSILSNHSLIVICHNLFFSIQYVYFQQNESIAVNKCVPEQLSKCMAHKEC